MRRWKAYFTLAGMLAGCALFPVLQGKTTTPPKVARLSPGQSPAPTQREVVRLGAVVGNPDRLRLRSGGTCHREIAQEQTLYETTDQKEIDLFVGSLSTFASEEQGECMCCGYPTLEFYRGGRLSATIGIQHGQALRWQGWSGDRELTTQSARYLQSWLSDKVPAEYQELLR